MSNFLFAQHNVCTFDFWQKYQKDWNSITIEHFPHLLFLQGNKERYTEYLKASWARNNRDEAARNKQISKFENLFESLKNSDQKKPITIIERNDGNNLVIDGNHRLAISWFLDKPIKTERISVKQYLKRLFAPCNTRFGTPSGIPYQTITIGDLTIEGRRNNINERNQFIRKEDLLGKTVLDFGCNFGESARYAEQLGAEVYAVDIDIILTVALRIATVTNQFLIPGDRLKRYNTGFFFSVHHHVDISKLVQKCDIVYLETHAHEKGEIPAFLKTWEKEALTDFADGRVLYRLKAPQKD